MAQDQGYAASLAGDFQGSSEAQQLLDGFWPKVVEDIKKLSPQEFKNQELPLARIKKIMKLDDDVKNMMISAEAPVLFAKAAEIFITELSLRAWVHTEDNKRRTLQRNDIAMAISKYDQFDFLIDIVPREEMKPNPKRTSSGNLNALQMSTGVIDGGISGGGAVQDPVQYLLQQAIPQNQPSAQQIQVIQTPQGHFALINGNIIQLQLPNATQPGGASGGGDASSGTIQLSTNAPQQQGGIEILPPVIPGNNGEVPSGSFQLFNNQGLRMQIPGQPGLGGQQTLLIQAPSGTSSGIQPQFQIAPGQFIVQAPSSNADNQQSGLDDQE